MQQVPPHGIAPGGEGQVLATVSGEAVWVAPNVLLIAHGAAVPVGTPAGTIIVEKGA